ncbi:putative retrovirus-related pol polyprotein from transposon opus [Trichonephila clavipes]|uniref:Putative retrovirus-related pol polyprotein from transposon opus n=1 Tax=Trichonephila clavipes TaxID=2585209 RepID=A0A8X6SVF2_TRICX|nr:putative retrovirus-related pol polyprotein from transposon opus [Trichonephila clavipes]
MPVPKDSSALQRPLGMFAHYCQWIPGFSKKIRPLLGKKQFPLSRDAVLTFNSLKDDVANAALAIIEDDIPFRVETDFAIGATLSQAGRPVAFFSRTLHASELRHSSPEKEAYAIVESLRHLRHFLMGKHFDDDDDGDLLFVTYTHEPFVQLEDVTCRNCGKKGHYQRVCRSRPWRSPSNVVASSNTLAAISGSTHCLQKSIIKALVNNI